MAWGGKICLVIKETGIARNVVSPKVFKCLLHASIVVVR